MPREGGQAEQRISIPHFEGVNSTVQHVIAKITELAHAENARTKVIGVVEKREGTRKFGTTANGYPFYALANFGLTKFLNDGSNQGVFRLTAAGVQDAATLTISIFDSVYVTDIQMVDSSAAIQIKVADFVTISEPTLLGILDGTIIVLDGTSIAASIYSLTNSSVWSALSDTTAQNIIGAPADFTRVEGNLVVTNQRDYNRMIASDGTTVISSADVGSLYNSPRAAKTVFYKGRIYLANIMRNGTKYPTTVMRSSFALGTIALLNGDLTAADSNGNWVFQVTDTKYFYTDTGMNQYEIYRGNILVATITLNSIQETSVTSSNANVTFAAGFSTFLSADEVWIKGTFTGDRQYRWVAGPLSVGRDVKQYDTFKLVGGDEDDINMMILIGNVLLIANKNTMMTWNDYTLQNMDLGVGCVSPHGYVKFLGSCFFLHYTGIYSTTGGVPTLLSRKIERYIRGASRAGLESASAGFKGLSVFFSIGDVNLYNRDDSFWKTLPDVCIEYHLADQNWYIHTNVPSEQFATFVDTQGADRLLYASTKKGASVKEFLVAGEGKDDGDAIFFRADTQIIQFIKTFETYAEPTNVITEIERGSLMQCFVALDEDDFYEIQGTFRKGVSTLKITSRDTDVVNPTPARKIRISYRDSSAQLCKLLQSSIAFVPGTKNTAGNE